MQKSLFSFNGFEMMGIQKMLLSLTLISLIERIAIRPSRLMNILSETSFAVFFLHPFVVKALQGAYPLIFTQIQWLDLAIVVGAVIFVCISIAFAVKSVLGTTSRYVTGY